MTKKNFDNLDGMNEEDYEGYRNWTPKQWAWEFLRRGEDFICKCKSYATEDKAVLRALAVEFGLRKFKHYLEDYDINEKPRFVSAIRYITNFKEEKSDLKTTLFRNEVFLKINLEAALSSTKIFNWQVKESKRTLEKLMFDLRASTDIKNIQSTRMKFTIDDYLKMLRLLDAKRSDSKMTRVNKFRVIYPDIAKNLDKDQITDEYKRRLNSARNLTSKHFEIAATPR